ncbi:CCA tRNA nucleotidyltransferase [Paenibacillus sacheonensis]|uniref:CCA tRNA nucleotidyltransferase n=1 Tax=Paenibacillus sacheonensis TaxID=742054 RepID=A0A7X4YMG0_9BACL|nr:CCA tRNA nucleotidyltransferase [Paenibacillus sacheonensis]MBM7564523.1 tRNA nucleotidyltransferase (CCA-adding enzyme) [Paenibacillus sacheonensis]NBC69082.1 CCA tRNA nucleotidyltransferase [Paenibacillus sacheonensis]
MSMSEALTKALPLLYKLEELGYETVFVGGCVRDTLLGKKLKDVDIATAATPEQVIAAFPHTVPTGLQHGTVTVVYEGETYEVTTFRTESEYEKFRRPSQVRFVTSLREDLQRRDFTMNSMAMRADGTLVDPFGGQDDLRRGLLRCVGEADDRLREDALRILRAVRFAAAYELRIAPATWRAILRHRHQLAHIAMERVGLECDKMIGGNKPHHAAALLARGGLLSCTKDPLPAELVEAASLYGDSVRLARASDKQQQRQNQQQNQQLAYSISQLHRLPDGDDRWAAACGALGLRAGQAVELFGLLKYSTARSERLAAILGVLEAMAPRFIYFREKHASSAQEWPAEEHRHWILTILRFGQPAAKSWCDITIAVPSLLSVRAEADEQPTAVDTYIDFLRSALQSMAAGTIKDLAVKGKELMKMADLQPGPWLGRLLQRLLETVALGEITNEKGPLMAKAAAILETNEV